MSSISESILEYIASAGAPVSIANIVKETEFSKAVVSRTLLGLVEGGKLIVSDSYERLSNGCSRKVKFYMIPASLGSDGNEQKIDVKAFVTQIRLLEQSMLDQYASFTVKTENELENTRRIELEASERTKKLYVDVITLMGVFISLFSIIVINIEAIQNAFSPQTCVWHSVVDLLLLNLPLVVSILVLLFGIRLLILRPIILKVNKKSSLEKVEDK
ncbi:MAG: hypothetical protein Q4C12_09165 [Clostridia bacterium]|nr:hypothetical protein [Clostridia bacterium]